jgi:hypothetical protein
MCNKMLDYSVLVTEFIKIVRNEVLHVQYTTRNTVIPFYKFNGRLEDAAAVTPVMWGLRVSQPSLRRVLLLGSTSNVLQQPPASCWFLLPLPFDLQVRGFMFLRNVGDSLRLQTFTTVVKPAVWYVFLGAQGLHPQLCNPS